MNILFSVNRNYMGHMKDCIASLIRFPTEEGYHIYILHSDLKEKDQLSLVSQFGGEGVFLHFVYVESSFLEKFPESGRYPKLIFYRIFSAFLLPEEMDRVLYLDADTIVINPLDELYRMDFGQNYFLACTHVRKVLNKFNQYRLGLDEERTYINSGVMLINLSALREQQNVEDVRNYVRKRKYYLTLPDQDIITALYGDKTGIVDTLKYNMSERMIIVRNTSPRHEKIDLEWIRKNTSVVHYCGRQKPWKKPYVGVLDVFYHELKAESSLAEAGA